MTLIRSGALLLAPALLFGLLAFVVFPRATADEAVSAAVPTPKSLPFRTLFDSDRGIAIIHFPDLSPCAVSTLPPEGDRETDLVQDSWMKVYEKTKWPTALQRADGRDYVAAGTCKGRCYVVWYDLAEKPESRATEAAMK